MKQCKTVFLFEYLGYIRSKGFIITTAIFLFLGVLMPSIPLILESTSDFDFEQKIEETFSGKVSKLAFVRHAALSEERVKNEIASYEISFFDDLDLAMQSLADGDVQAVVALEENHQYKMYVEEMNISNYGVIENLDDFFRKIYIEEQLRQKGLTIEEISLINQIKPQGQLISTKNITDINESGEDSEQMHMKNMVYAYVLVFLLYFTLILYGQYVVASVISEKSSKAIEILITSIKPKYLMFGKVLGAGCAGLTQFVIIMMGSFASFKINSGLLMSESVNEGMGMLLTPSSTAIYVYFVTFFILGFFIYAFLFASFASTVNRMEEANAIMTGPILLIVVGFLVALSALGNPYSQVVKVFSYIPFFSPMVMFSRICLGAATTIEATISIAVLIGSVIFIGLFSAKLYRMGVLMYGKPPKMKEIIKMMYQAKV